MWLLIIAGYLVATSVKFVVADRTDIEEAGRAARRILSVQVWNAPSHAWVAGRGIQSTSKKFPEISMEKGWRSHPRLSIFYLEMPRGTQTLECPKTLQKQAVRKAMKAPHDHDASEKQECKWKIIFLLAKVLVTAPDKVADSKYQMH